MESKRQLQVARLLQKELASYFQVYGKQEYGAFITVMSTSISPDLQVCKSYLSIFMAQDKEAVLAAIKLSIPSIRKTVGIKCGKQLRVIPEFIFYLDNSLDYVDKIEQLLKK